MEVTLPANCAPRAQGEEVAFFVMLALGHVVAEAAGLLGRLFALLWSALAWGVWLMFAVWVPISFVGLAIGAMLG